jgi:predicted  nucleic acid-binding Zn-ribbon protein
MTATAVLSLLTALGLGAVLVEIVRSFFQRKNMGADYASVISSSAVSLLEPLNKQIADLKKEVEEAKTQAHAATVALREVQEELRTERQKRIEAEDALTQKRIEAEEVLTQKRIDAEDALTQKRIVADASLAKNREVAQDALLKRRNDADDARDLRSRS